MLHSANPASQHLNIGLNKPGQPKKKLLPNPEKSIKQLNWEEYQNHFKDQVANTQLARKKYIANCKWGSMFQKQSYHLSDFSSQFLKNVCSREINMLKSSPDFMAIQNWKQLRPEITERQVFWEMYQNNSPLIKCINNSPSTPSSNASTIHPVHIRLHPIKGFA